VTDKRPTPPSERARLEARLRGCTRTAAREFALEVSKATRAYLHRLLLPKRAHLAAVTGTIRSSAPIALAIF